MSDGWISVEDRLPEYHEIVEIKRYDTRTKGEDKKIIICRGIFSIYSHQWRGRPNGKVLKGVIAWRRIKLRE